MPDVVYATVSKVLVQGRVPQGFGFRFRCADLQRVVMLSYGWRKMRESNHACTTAAIPAAQAA